MNTLSTNIDTRRILGISAHGDDTEMQLAGLLDTADESFAYVATRGEATTLNYSGRSLCRRARAS